MFARILSLAFALCLAGAAHVVGKEGSPSTDWSMNATIIEACSCPMFCQCYFNPAPAGHEHGGGPAEHFCRFNNAFRVNKGHYGSVTLDGATFWVAGDLGAEFTSGQMDWAVMTFDKSLTPEQRDAISAIVGHLYPVKWGSFTTAEGTIDTWTSTAETAHATLDGGKSAEVTLMRPAGSANGAGSVVIKNLKYWGAPRNEGFVLMPNEVEAYRVGPKAFEFRGTNGFMITFDISSKDQATTAPSGGY